MWTNVILKVVEYGIMFGVKWLVNHEKVGIGSKLAKAMVDGVAKSTENPTTVEMFKDAMEVL